MAQSGNARATLPAYPSNGQIAAGCMQRPVDCCTSPALSGVRLQIQACQCKASLTKACLACLQERVRWRREMDKAMDERDMLGTQLVRRNDELALLHEKLRLQEATIAQGRKAYE